MRSRKVVALPSGQSLLCIHSCVAAPEDSWWISRPTSTPSAYFFSPFLSLPGGTAKMINYTYYYWQEDKGSLNCHKKCSYLNLAHLLLLRLLLWWRCLLLEPERDRAFFFLSRLRDRDRRFSLLLLWCRLKATRCILWYSITLLFKKSDQSQLHN